MAEEDFLEGYATLSPKGEAYYGSLLDQPYCKLSSQEHIRFSLMLDIVREHDLRGGRLTVRQLLDTKRDTEAARSIQRSEILHHYYSEQLFFLLKEKVIIIRTPII